MSLHPPPSLPPHMQRVLVTGGAGFIGGAMVRHLLRHSHVQVFNLDKLGYASDCISIERLQVEIGSSGDDRHTLLQVDLADREATAAAVRQADPALVLHLAAESHVDRSISGPDAFINSNVNGTFQLLQTVRMHWEGAPHHRLITLVKDRSGHDRRYVMDASRLRSELGWRPRHSFAQGLDATVRWYLENLSWCEAMRFR